MNIQSRLSSSDNRVLARVESRLQGIYCISHKFRGIIKCDFKRHYRNLMLGYPWHAILSVILISIDYSVFNSIFEIDIGDYQVYLSLGILFFMIFLQCTTDNANCLVGNKGMGIECDLGLKCRDGTGMPIDSFETARLFRMAAEFGNRDAVLALSKLRGCACILFGRTDPLQSTKPISYRSMCSTLWFFVHSSDRRISSV